MSVVKYLVRGSLGLCFAFVLAACDNKDEYVPPPPAKVTVAQPVKQTVTRYMELTGNTTAVQQVDLNARVAGYLEQINYKDGASAQKGDVLFVIEQAPYQAQLDQANAQVAADQAALTDAQTELDRQTALLARGNAPQSVVDKATAARDEAQAALQQAKASVEIATINLGYTTVTAPFDGVVSAHLADVGALVGYSSPTKLATITQLDPIYVIFTVSERQVLLIKEHLAKEGRSLADVGPVPVQVGLQTDQGYPHEGKLDYVAPNVDLGTGTLEARGIFENKGRILLPGLFVRVRVPLEKIENALLVDDRAVGTDQRGPYVLVIDQNNEVQQRSVETGQLEGGLRVVTSGLAADDWVVVGGIARAIPGSKVDPQKSDQTAAAADQTTTKP